MEWKLYCFLVLTFSPMAGWDDSGVKVKPIAFLAGMALGAPVFAQNTAKLELKNAEEKPRRVFEGEWNFETGAFSSEDGRDSSLAAVFYGSTKFSFR